MSKFKKVFISVVIGFFCFSVTNVSFAMENKDSKKEFEKDLEKTATELSTTLKGTEEREDFSKKNKEEDSFNLKLKEEPINKIVEEKPNIDLEKGTKYDEKSFQENSKKLIERLFDVKILDEKEIFSFSNNNDYYEELKGGEEEYILLIEDMLCFLTKDLPFMFGFRRNLEKLAGSDFESFKNLVFERFDEELATIFKEAERAFRGKKQKDLVDFFLGEINEVYKDYKLFLSKRVEDSPFENKSLKNQYSKFRQVFHHISKMIVKFISSDVHKTSEMASTVVRIRLFMHRLRVLCITDLKDLFEYHKNWVKMFNSKSVNEKKKLVELFRDSLNSEKEGILSVLENLEKQENKRQAQDFRKNNRKKFLSFDDIKDEEQREEFKKAYFEHMNKKATTQEQLFRELKPFLEERDIEMLKNKKAAWVKDRECEFKKEQLKKSIENLAGQLEYERKKNLIKDSDVRGSLLLNMVLFNRRTPNRDLQCKKYLGTAYGNFKIYDEEVKASIFHDFKKNKINLIGNKISELCELDSTIGPTTDETALFFEKIKMILKNLERRSYKSILSTEEISGYIRKLADYIKELNSLFSRNFESNFKKLKDKCKSLKKEINSLENKKELEKKKKELKIEEKRVEIIEEMKELVGAFVDKYSYIVDFLKVHYDRFFGDSASYLSRQIEEQKTLFKQLSFLKEIIRSEIIDGESLKADRDAIKAMIKKIVEKQADLAGKLSFTNTYFSKEEEENEKLHSEDVLKYADYIKNKNFDEIKHLEFLLGDFEKFKYYK